VILPVGELGIGEERLVIQEGQVGPIARRFYDAITGIQLGGKDPHGWAVPVG
jgi:branched-chain amino acid aminotransferase